MIKLIKRQEERKSIEGEEKEKTKGEKKVKAHRQRDRERKKEKAKKATIYRKDKKKMNIQ